MAETYRITPMTLPAMREWVSALMHDYAAWCRGNRPDLPNDFWRTVHEAQRRLSRLELKENHDR